MEKSSSRPRILGPGSVGLPAALESTVAQTLCHPLKQRRWQFMQGAALISGSGSGGEPGQRRQRRRAQTRRQRPERPSC